MGPLPAQHLPGPEGCALWLAAGQPLLSGSSAPSSGDTPSHPAVFVRLGPEAVGSTPSVRSLARHSSRGGVWRRVAWRNPLESRPGRLVVE